MTQLECLNVALEELGQVEMATLTPNSEAAQIVMNRMQLSKRDVLYMHHWNAATREATLTANLGAPVFSKYLYGFSLPTDYLMLLYENNGIKLQKRGQYLYGDTDPVSITYLADIPIEEMEDWLANLVALRTAADVCVRITGSVDTRFAIEANFRDKKIKARGLDSTESKEKPHGSTTFWTAEYGN